MTLYEFNQMDEAEQMEVIWDSAFVADREDSEHAILLYQVDGFYVEVYYHKEYNDIRRFRSFSSTDQLAPYLEKIDSPTGATSESIRAWFNTSSYGNAILATNEDVKLAAPFNYSNPDCTPQTGSPALAGASFVNGLLASGFKNVTYRGAAGAGDTWYKGWAKF